MHEATSDLAARWVAQDPSLAPLAPAIRLREAGRHAEAVAWLRERVQASGRDASTLALLAISLWQVKDDAGAAAALNDALQLEPEAPLVQRTLARGLLRAGRAADALAAAERARRAQPANPEGMLVLAMAADASGRSGPALETLDAALAAWPDYAEARAVRALVRRKLGDVSGALADADAAIEAKPSLAAAWGLAAQLRRQAGDLPGAIAALERAAALEPGVVAHQVNLGEYLRQAGRFPEARQVLEAAVERHPAAAEPLFNLGVLAAKIHDWETALAWFSRATALRPGDARFLANQALALLELRRAPGEIEPVVHKALAIAPNHEEALCVLANLRRREGYLGQADRLFGQVLSASPDSLQALIGRALVLMDMGRVADAETCVRRACELEPANAEWFSILTFVTCWVGREPREVLGVARRFGQLATDQATLWGRGEAVRVGPRQGRKLRVGYLSGDYRRHPVSFFVEPLFRAHDRQRVEVYAYYNHGKVEPVTERIRDTVDAWRQVRPLPDFALNQLIVADEIDVLVDLSGHTSHTRLGALARRAAPVQAHYLGFFGTTGLPAMDYWIGDPVLTPASVDEQFSEAVWRLPRVWIAYQPPQGAPEPRRAGEAGVLRVGSFNALGKLTPATFDLWAKVLREIPNARLVLKNKELADSGNRARVSAAFAERAVAADRLELYDTQVTKDWDAHMDLYSRIDVGLDPVGGVGGGTTSCEALWMGVPLVALSGDRLGSRMSATMLDSIGAGDLVAGSDEAYVAAVARLGADPARLDAIRAGQRARMAASPLCDVKGLASALEDAYEAMFDRWAAQAVRP